MVVLYCSFVFSTHPWLVQCIHTFYDVYKQGLFRPLIISDHLLGTKVWKFRIAHCYELPKIVQMLLKILETVLNSSYFSMCPNRLMLFFWNFWDNRKLIGTLCALVKGPTGQKVFPLPIDARMTQILLPQAVKAMWYSSFSAEHSYENNQLLCFCC